MPKKKKDRKKGLLKGLTFTEVSHVHRGANQGAHVSLFKMEENPEEFAKRTFAEIVDGMELSEEARKMIDTLYLYWDALSNSVWDILFSDKYTDKKADIKQSLADYIGAVSSMTEDKEFLKSASEVIEKATKKEQGEEFTAADYAYTPDKDKPSTWKLRLTNTPGGDPDSKIVGAAVAALGPKGFRGNKVQIPEEDLPGVKAKVRRAWLKANPDKSKEDLPTAIQKTQEEIEMKKTLEFYKAMSTLTDIQKEYFNGLSDSEKDAIVKEDSTAEQIVKSVEEGAKEFAKSKANDEVFSMNGVDVRKSEVGDSMFTILKAQQAQIDNANSRADKAEQKLEKSDLEAEAVELFPNLPGTAEEKGNILKSIRTLPEDQQEKQIQMLKAGDEALAKQMGEKGFSKSDGDDQSPNEQLEALAKTYAKDNSVSFEKAYSAVLDTKEGQELYNKSRTA